MMVGAMAASRITSDEREAIVSTLRATESVSETARRHKRSKSAVSRIAVEDGIATSERPRTQKATAASLEDSKARRARIESNFLHMAEVFQWVALTEPLSPRDVKDVVLSGAISLDKAIAVSRHDVKADEGNAGGLLVQFVDQLREPTDHAT